MIDGMYPHLARPRVCDNVIYPHRTAASKLDGVRQYANAMVLNCLTYWARLLPCLTMVAIVQPAHMALPEWQCLQSTHMRGHDQNASRSNHDAAQPWMQLSKYTLIWQHLSIHH